MAGYKVLRDNSKKNTILIMEGICPCCGTYPSKYIEKRDARYKGKPAIQFLYICPKCASRWEGNYYDERLNLV